MLNLEEFKFIVCNRMNEFSDDDIRFYFEKFKLEHLIRIRLKKLGNGVTLIGDNKRGCDIG